MLALVAEVGNFVDKEKLNSIPSNQLIMYNIKRFKPFSPHMLAMLAGNPILPDSKENKITSQQRQQNPPNNLAISLIVTYAILFRSTILPTTGNKRQH